MVLGTSEQWLITAEELEVLYYRKHQYARDVPSQRMSSLRELLSSVCVAKAHTRTKICITVSDGLAQWEVGVNSS